MRKGLLIPVPSYWDEGNKNEYPWYKRGIFKRLGTKKAIRREQDWDKSADAVPAPDPKP